MSTGSSTPSTAAEESRQPAPGHPRKRRGCLAQGCLTLLGLLSITILVVSALLLRVPQQLGFWPSGAQLLDGTPDRASAATIVAQLKKSGVNTTGLSLYVLPVKGQNGTLAYAVLDASAGFTFPTDTNANPLLDMFGKLAGGPTVNAAHVTQLAIEYRDARGHAVGVLTASTAAIRQFIDGQIDEQSFSKQLHGDVDVTAALQGVSGP